MILKLKLPDRLFSRSHLFLRNEYLAFTCLILSSFGLCALSEEKSEEKNVDKQSHGSVLSVEPRAFDFGKVEAGSMLSHKFVVKNLTGEVLHLRASTSCGCTAPTLEKTRLAPAESTTLSVSIDTAMKQDSVSKTVTIHSDDSRESRTELKMTMLVTDPHASMSAEGGAKIFTDQHCANCHVARGEGKFGRELYNADCAMCHGPKAEGAVGPALFGPYRKKEYAQFMKNIVENGSATHRSMPGFLDANGGPLTPNQVQSILDYLAALSNARSVGAPNAVLK